jgi:hypothetical protein
MNIGLLEELKTATERYRMERERYRQERRQLEVAIARAEQLTRELDARLEAEILRAAKYGMAARTI